MAGIEARAAENVAEACAATSSVRNYVLTSSLLACIWRNSSNGSLSPVVDHNSWSDESFCSSKNLWYALGKLKAEKVSWRIAGEKGLRLTTICPGLITGPRYFCTNPSSTIAYLKGGQDMYAHGLLATVDVNKLVDAHAGIRSVYVGNFSWDFVYTEYVMDDRYHHKSIVCQIAEDYSHCQFRIRLPGYCLMPAFRDIIGVSLVVRRLHKSRKEVRSEMGISEDVKLVILNFWRTPSRLEVERGIFASWLALLGCAASEQELPPNFIQLPKDVYTPDVMAASDCMIVLDCGVVQADTKVDLKAEQFYIKGLGLQKKGVCCSK